MSKVYQVYYWDPCNGMSGRSEFKGTWADEKAAQAYADEHNKGAWMQNSHTVRPLEVIDVDTPHIDVRFHFDEIAEDGYTHYDLVSVQRIGTDIPQDEMLGIGETLGQSDHWHVGGVNATLDAMVDSDEPKLVKDYR